jgi:hypothetical protein
MTDPFAITPLDPPASPTMAPFNSPMHDRMCRVGLWLGVLSGVLCLVGGFGNRVVAEQGFNTIIVEQGAFIGVGIAMIVMIGATVFMPFAWSRITGIGLLAVAAFIYGVLITVARADDQLSVGETISLGSGGLMLLLAFLAATTGLVFALIGAPRIGRPAALSADGQPMRGQSGYAVTSLVLSLCGLFVGFTAPLGIAFAVAAFDDDKQSRGQRTGRGMAVAGLVVGIVVVALSALFMAIFIGTADPSFSETQ